MTALVLWTIGAVDRAVSALRGRARVIASGGSRTLEMPSGVSFLLAFGINTGLVGSGLWPVGLLPERKPVQPATARPHTPRYRQNPRNLALGWCLIRSFWLNQLTLCWRGLDSNFQYVRELAPSLRGRPRPQSLPQLARAEDRSCDAADRLGVYRQRQRCPRMDFLQLVHQRWMPCLRHTSTVFAPA
jgi:hypothetical protein